jgi:tetratricopeptide (TPR) repeat protein
LFRLISPNFDIDYNDLELIRGDQGVRVVDIYNYGDGEQLSKAITGKLLDAEKTAPKSDTDRENARLVGQAEQFLYGGNPDEAYSFYDQITDKAKKEQPIQRLHVRIAVKMGDSVYKAALKEYQSNFPQDPFIYLAIFKNDARIQDFPGSLEALDRFERFLPSDPFLDFFRAFIYKQMSNPLQSRLALERFHAWNPLNINVLVELVDNHVKAGHLDSAAMLVLDAEQKKIITPEQVDTVKRIYPALRTYLK